MNPENQIEHVICLIEFEIRLIKKALRHSIDSYRNLSWDVDGDAMKRLLDKLECEGEA